MPQLGETKRSKTGRLGRWDGTGWEDITNTNDEGMPSAPAGTSGDTRDAQTRLAGLKATNAQPLKEPSSYAGGFINRAISEAGGGLYNVAKGALGVPKSMIQNVANEFNASKRPSREEEHAALMADIMGTSQPAPADPRPMTEQLGELLGQVGMMKAGGRLLPSAGPAGPTGEMPVRPGGIANIGRTMNKVGTLAEEGKMGIVPFRQWLPEAAHTLSEEFITKPIGARVASAGRSLEGLVTPQHGPETPFNPAEHKVMGDVARTNYQPPRGIEPTMMPPPPAPPEPPAAIPPALASLRNQQMSQRPAPPIPQTPEAPVNEPPVGGPPAAPNWTAPTPAGVKPMDLIMLKKAFPHLDEAAVHRMAIELANNKVQTSDVFDPGPMNIKSMGPGATNQLMGNKSTPERAGVHKILGGLDAEGQKAMSGEPTHLGQDPRWNMRENGRMGRTQSVQSDASAARGAQLIETIKNSALSPEVKKALLGAVGAMGLSTGVGLTSDEQ